MAEDSKTVLTGSESRFDLVCVPCNSAGKHLEAEGYCTDCCEHLCAQCLSYHRTLSALKHHKLVDKTSMPQDQTDPIAKDVCTERCSIHTGKVLEYFCPIHKVLGCSVCMTLTHKQCEDVAYIPELSADLEHSEEYKFFRQGLEELIRKSYEVIRSSKKKMDQSAYLYSECQHVITTFRQEINTALDQLEKEFKSKCGAINSQNIKAMEIVSGKTNQTLDELQALSTDFQELLRKKQYCQTFTKMKNTDLIPLQDKLKDMENTNILFCTFRPGEEFLQLLKGKDGIGKLLVFNIGKYRAAGVTDINVRTKANKRTCSIKGCALLSKDKLVVTDRKNETVKLIDLSHNNVVSELKLEKYPWSVSAIDNDRVAVTIPTKGTIVLLRCDDRLVIYKELRIKGQCYGISYYQDKLIVACHNPSKVDVLSMSGDVVQRFENDGREYKLFVRPQFVTVYTKEPSIFVSDCGNDSLIKLSMDGKIQAVYRDSELRCPGQFVIDEAGLVYLCGESSNNVHLLTNKCTQLKIILTRANGLSSPQAICCNEAIQRLYVGMYDNDYVKVFV